MTWNKRYEQFALSCRIRPSTAAMLRWILRRAKQNQISEIEVDLRIFNNWIGKHKGSPYDRKTIREAIAQLDERLQGLIIVTKQYTPWVLKLVVRPLSFVLRKNSLEQGKTPKLTTGNPMFDASHKKRCTEQQQQNISKLDTLFREIGLTYSRDALARIWRLADKNIEEVHNSIELLLHRHSFSQAEITNAHGFIIESLKHGWYYDSELCQPADLPVFDTFLALAESLKRLRQGEVWHPNGLRYQT